MNTCLALLVLLVLVSVNCLDAIIVEIPNGGESWRAGSQQTIRWYNDNSTWYFGKSYYWYSTDSANSWIFIGEERGRYEPYTWANYSWTVANENSTHCRIKVKAESVYPPYYEYDESNSDFTIYQSSGFEKDKSSKQIPEINKIEFYPNPFSNKLTVITALNGAVYDIWGRIIIRFNKGKQTIDTSFWQPGVYIIQTGKQLKRIVKF